jgi:hypothetical protein
MNQAEHGNRDVATRGEILSPLPETADYPAISDWAITAHRRHRNWN